jgi:hypothetical protein
LVYLKIKLDKLDIVIIISFLLYYNNISFFFTRNKYLQSIYRKYHKIKLNFFLLYKTIINIKINNLIKNLNDERIIE